MSSVPWELSVPRKILELSQVLKSREADKVSTGALALRAEPELGTGRGLATIASNCFSLYPDQHFKAHHFIGLRRRAEQSQSSLKDVTVVLSWDE